MPVSDAKEMILRTSAKELLKHRPSWLKDCVRISVSAQNITTGEVLYRRTINIKKKEEDDLKAREIAVRLIGERETVAYTVKEGLPLWEQDKKFIIELMKEERK